MRRIGLTGGESTIHPDFLKIAMFVLENGFDLCVFTNGYNFEVIEKLLLMSKEYKFSIKVSLDGIAEVHNGIRGNHVAYQQAIKTIELINQFSNVKLYISTTVMKDNVAHIAELDEMIRERYPKAIHTKDIAFPVGSARDCIFGLEEMEQIEHSVPDIFQSQGMYMEAEENKAIKKVKELRCTGGVTQCTLMPSGTLKICNAACDERFYFENNVYETGLKYAWVNCGENIAKYRKEKRYQTSDCKKCSARVQCNRNDCRVLAWAYTGDEARSNPTTCYAIHQKEKGKTL